MGRRPVGTKKERNEVPQADSALESESNGPSQGSVTSRGQDQVAQQAELPEAGTVAVTTAESTERKQEDKAEAEKDDANPWMGLVHYGSESEDEGTPTVVRKASSSVSQVKTIKSAAAFESESVVSSSSPVPTVAADAHETTVLELPKGWVKCMDNSGADYYWNTESDETTWELPAGACYRRRGVSVPSSTSSSSANDTGGTTEGDKVASDGTSDTASDPGDVDTEDVKRSTDSSSPISSFTAAATESASKGLEGNETILQSGSDRKPDGAGNTSGLKFEHIVDAGTSGVNNDAELPDADATFRGVDDLLAGIEAEMMSGTMGGGSETQSSDDGNNKAIDKSEDTKRPQEDFAPLKAIESRLDERARRLHAELIECLAVVVKEDGGEVGRQACGLDVKRKLALELSAVLRARLSDWREGGLDGSFLVRKLEEMTVQARSSLLDSNGLVATSQPTKTDNIPLVANASPSETPVTVTATTSETSVTGGIVDQKEPPPSKGVSVKKRKSNDKSKKGRRLGSGPIRSSLVAIAKKGIVESKMSGSGDDGSERGAEFGSSTLEADAKKAAEVLREAETVEKLRWADEVSAAATAAVAAAVKAKEEEAKAKERSKTERELLPQQEDGDGSRGEGMEPPEQDGSGEEGEIIEVVNAKAKVASASVADESSVIPKDSGKNGEGNDETGEEPRTGVPPTKIELASEGEGESTVKSSLPSGWTAVWDKAYSTYYYHNTSTDETTWVLPSNEAATETPPDDPVEEAPRRNAPSPSFPLVNGMEASTDIVDYQASEETSEDGQQEEKRSSKASEQHQSLVSGETVFEQAEASLESGTGDSKKAEGLEETSTREEAASAASAMASAKDGCAIKDEKEAGAAQDEASLSVDELPRGWVAIWDENHNAYYYHNTETDETSWERPIAPVQSDESELPSANACEVEPSQGDKTEVSTFVGASNAVDMRPSTLVWWSDAGDVWTGESLSGLLVGYGPRRYRNLGGGYYMLTLEMGAEWAAAAVAALGHGVIDPVSAARVDWVCCTASTSGYGLFLRWAADDDEQNLFDVPSELFTDPLLELAVPIVGDEGPAVHAAALAEAEAEAAREEAEANAAAAAAVAATQAAEAAGSKTAAEVLANVETSAPVPKKRKSSKGSGKGASIGSISKKRKGAASLIDKWKAVASTASEEAEREAERQEKLERWKARAAAADPDNPNFMPLGRKR